MACLEPYNWLSNASGCAAPAAVAMLLEKPLKKVSHLFQLIV